MTYCTVLTHIHRNVHPKVTLLVSVLDKTTCAIDYALVANVRTDERDVALLDTSCCELCFSRILATVLINLVEKVDKGLIVKTTEVVNSACFAVISSNSVYTRHS